MEVFVAMTNSGFPLQKSLTAVLITGMEIAREVLKDPGELPTELEPHEWTQANSGLDTSQFLG